MAAEVDENKITPSLASRRMGFFSGVNPVANEAR
jgi:hypothetical protein